jgi:hypothetical protein
LLSSATTFSRTTSSTGDPLSSGQVILKNIWSSIGPLLLKIEVAASDRLAGSFRPGISRTVLHAVGSPAQKEPLEESYGI